MINSLSDHFPVFYIEETKQSKVKLPEIVTRKINSKTIPSFCKMLQSTSWKNVLNEVNPSVAFNNFYEKLNAVRDIAFPEIKIKPKPTKFQHSPFMTLGLQISQKRKEKLFAKKVKCSSENNLEKFKAYNTLYNKIRRAAKKMYYTDQFNKFIKNSKETWKVIREIIGTNKQKDQLPEFFKCNGQVISDYMEIANGFNNFFSQVGPDLASEIGPSDKNYNDYPN